MARQTDPSPTLEPYSGLTLGLVIGRHTARSHRFTALNAALGGSGIQVRTITVPALPVPALPGSDPRHPATVARDLCVVPSPPDVVLVDLAATDRTDALEAVQGCPELAGVPVVVHLEHPDQFGVQQHLHWDVADFVSSSTSADEMVHRLRVIAARRARGNAAEEATDALRARVRSVSAALADNTETRDPRVLARVFVRGLADAFNADRVYLDLFDDERAGALTEQWPTYATGLPAPGVAGSDAEPLAHHLWDARWVGIFNTPSSQNSHDNEDCNDSNDSGINGDSQEAGEISIRGLSEDSECTPRCTVAVPLGDTARVSGLVQLISDTGPLPWSEVHTALMQHVAGNFVRALRQVNLHARQTEAIERLAYLNFLKDDFVATINHEFRGPLATITGHLEMVADGFLGPIPENQRDTLDVLQRNTARLNKLVENILTVSVLDQPRSQPTPVNLTDVVRTVVTGLQAAAAAKALVVTTDLPAEPVIVTGHRGQLEEALRNVLWNSLDFTAPTGTITVTVAPAPAPAPAPASELTPVQASDPEDVDGPGHVLITVQDTGVGIPANDLPHLYTSFYRGSNIKRSSTTGSGLGLTITKQIIDRHQGTITIDSTHESVGDPGTTTGGTTVSMAFPLPKP